jgi:Zn-finger nucleic acid-binding protein
MKCPNCDVFLVMADRSGIEIDYCPQCRGVWLDKGELDKIIERSAQAEAPSNVQAPMPTPPPQRQYPEQHKYEDRDKQHYQKDNPYYKKKKGGFLGEIFDFD